MIECFSVTLHTRYLMRGSLLSEYAAHTKLHTSILRVLEMAWRAIPPIDMGVCMDLGRYDGIEGIYDGMHCRARGPAGNEVIIATGILT